MVSHRYAAGALTAMLAVLGLAAPVRNAHAQAPTKAMFQALYDRQDAAQEKRDINSMMAFVSPGIQIEVAGGQKMGYNEMKAMLMEMLPRTKSIKTTTAVQSIKVHGKSVVARVADHARMVINDSKTGKPQTWVLDATSSDTWQKSNGKWLMTATVPITQKTTIDGKPAPNGL